MSTDERESDASVSVSDEPAEPKRMHRDAEAQARDRGRDHRCRPVQEAPEDHDSSRRRSIGSTRSRSRRLRKEAVVPGFRPGRAPRQLVVKRFQQAGLRPGQVDPADVVARADRQGLQARADHAAAARRRGDRDPRRRADELRDGRRGAAAVRRCPNYKGLTVKRPVAELTEKDVDDQLHAIPRGPRADRAQARRGRRARRLSHGRPGVHRPGRASA